MYKGKTIAVVVPAYCEEGFVGEVIETVPDFVDRIYAIDDDSPDGTWEEIRETADRVNEEWRRREAIADGGVEPRQRVVAIRREDNGGVGAAITHGYKQAYADGMDVVAVMNGDGQMDPGILDRIVDPVVTGEADYAKGNRLLRPEDREDMSRFRFFGNAVLSLLTKFASGYWKITDPQNGYTAISREAIERLDFEGIHEDYGFLNQLLVRLNTRGFRVADVSMPAKYGDETSSIRISRFAPKLSALLLTSFLWRLKVRYLVYDFHPLVLFYVAGSMGIGGGVAGLVGAAYLFETGGTGLLTAAVSLLSVVVGSLALGSAMLLDMYENDDLEVRQYDRRENDTGVEHVEWSSASDGGGSGSDPST